MKKEKNSNQASEDDEFKRPIYLSQRELAERWKMTECSIKNLRVKGKIPYFCPPGSSRFLYPVNGIKAIERQHQTQKEIPDNRTKENVRKRERPLVPPKTVKQWEV